jgi:hypothetical protein
MLVTAAAAVAAAPQQVFTHNAITQGYGGVGSSTPPAKKPVLHQVAGASKTQQKPAAAAAPASHVSGALPFTGLQLGVFVLIGIALIGGGLLVRRFGGSRADG